MDIATFQARCDECHRPVSTVVCMGHYDERGFFDQEESGADICRDCLIKALSLFDTLEWHPASEPPTEGGRYLTWDITTPQFGPEENVYSRIERTWYTRDGDIDVTFTPSHWRPLPPPPTATTPPDARSE